MRTRTGKRFLLLRLSQPPKRGLLNFWFVASRDIHHKPVALYVGPRVEQARRVQAGLLRSTAWCALADSNSYYAGEDDPSRVRGTSGALVLKVRLGIPSCRLYSRSAGTPPGSIYIALRERAYHVGSFRQELGVQTRMPSRHRTCAVRLTRHPRPAFSRTPTAAWASFFHRASSHTSR